MKITNVMASSVDGFIGAKPNESDIERQQVRISSKADHDHLLSLMKSADAIIVGASSVRANSECLELINRENPHWYILAQSEIDQNMNFWTQKSIVRNIVSSNRIPTYSSDVNFIHIPTQSHLDLVDELVSQLRAKGYKKVLLFGGGEVNSWFYSRKLVDELYLTIAPVIIASAAGSHLINPALDKPVSLNLKHCKQEEDFLFLHYEVLK